VLGLWIWSNRQALHRKWRGSCQEVLVFDPLVAAETVGENGAKNRLGCFVRRFGLYFSHAPLTPQTRHLINEVSLQKMKPTAILVNTSRGELIDEKALIKALSRIRFLQQVSMFLKRSLFLLITFPEPAQCGSHRPCGVYSKDAVKELQTRGAQEVLRVLSGEPPQCWVNRW